jgi:hypothetical protein
MPTEIHDPLNVEDKDEQLKDIHACIDYLYDLMNNNVTLDVDIYMLGKCKAYVEEHSHCIKIDRWHAQTVREKVDD